MPLAVGWVTGPANAVGPVSGPAHAVLAASSSTASQVAPGALGFLVVAGMAVALFFLIRSMNKQLAKVGAARRRFVVGQPQKTKDENLPNGSSPES